MTQATALTIEETGDTVIIKRDGVEIDLGPNHSVVVHSDGIVVHSDGDVKLQPAPANDTTITAATAALLGEGNKMQDGSTFAGISPDTGKQMFAMPADARVMMTFNEAAQYAKDLNGVKTLGHDDWRVPTKAELNVLFQNRDKGALKGTFDLTGSYPSGWYWSDTPFRVNVAYGQRFSDGQQDGFHSTFFDSSVRCVR